MQNQARNPIGSFLQTKMNNCEIILDKVIKEYERLERQELIQALALAEQFILENHYTRPDTNEWLSTYGTSHRATELRNKKSINGHNSNRLNQEKRNS